MTTTKRRGRPPSAQPSAKLEIRLPAHTLEAVRIAAGPRHGASAQWVRDAIDAALGRVNAVEDARLDGIQTGLRDARAAIGAREAWWRRDST